MDALDLENVTNVWQFLAFAFTITVVTLGGWFMKRTKDNVDKEENSSKEIAKQVAQVPGLADTVKVLTKQVLELADANDELRNDFNEQLERVRRLERMESVYTAWRKWLKEEMPSPPFLDLDDWLALHK